jgi:hypothetical protein
MSEKEVKSTSAGKKELPKVVKSKIEKFSKGGEVKKKKKD